MLTSPNVACKRWVFEQYDSIVQGQTVAGAGSDAAVVRVPGTMKALALSSDGKGRYGALDPYLGAMHAVAEAARNVAVTGATPARDHELPELREPRTARGHVAILRVDPRDARRVPRVRDAGDRRERQLLQRVRRLGDLAHAGDRDARTARRSPAPRAHRLPTSRARRLPAGGDLRRARRLRVRRGGARRGCRTAARARPGARGAGSCASCEQRRPRRSSRAATTAATAGSRSRSPSRRSRVGTGSP